MNTRSLLVRLMAAVTLVCALTLGNVGAQVTTFNDATGDIDPTITTAGGTLDIVKMEVVDTETDVVFTMTVNGDFNNIGWGNFMLGIANQKIAGSQLGNGWGRPINLNAGGTNGMTHWIGSWVGGSQLWAYAVGGGGGTGGNWSGPGALTSYSTAAGAQSTLTYTVSKASLGVTNGDTIIFDAYSSGGGGGDSAIDALSNPNISVNSWGQIYTSTATNLTRSYTLANTALNTTQDITFSVNMTAQTAVGNFNPATDFVSVEWGIGFPAANFAYLTDTDNDGIYTGVVSVSAPANTPVPYRYVNEPGNTSLPLVRETVSRSFTMPTSALVITPTPYFDNIQGYRDVTFSVNMTVQTTLGTFVPASNIVEIRGPFNNWNGGAAWQLADGDGDGIYTGTFRFGGTPSQTIEYKYYATGTLGYESTSNRSFSLTFNSDGNPLPADVLTPVYFNNQDTVPQNRNVTFSVNMGFQISSGAFVPASGVVDVRGTFNGWSGGTSWQLTDVDGDGIYTGTFNLIGTEGAAQEYKFWATGPTWESVPNRTFNLGPSGVAQVLTPTPYFNNNSGQTRDVTFSVDMSIQEGKGLFNPSTGVVELRGIGGFGAAEAKTLTRVGTSLVYEGTFAVPGDDGSSFAYKFYSTGVTAGGFEVINPNDLFQNRTATLGTSGTPQTLPLAYFSNELFYVTGTPLSAFSTVQGTASTAQSVTVNGQGLTGDIIATAPTGFEVSADGTTYGPTANIVPVSGSVSAASLSVRIAASAAAGSPSGNVQMASTGSQQVNVAVSGTVTASGETFSNWSGGQSNTPTLQLQYAIGGATSPTATNGVAPVTTVSSNTLAITAIVRTNDPNLAVAGQAVTDLSAGTWSTNNVTMTPGDQTGVGAGLQRQIWSTPVDAESKKFLQLRTILTNP